LNQGEVWPDLVRPVDGKFQLAHLIERCERDTKPLRIGARCFGGGHANDVQPGPYAFPQELEEKTGGRAGAKPNAHAGAHKLKCACGGISLIPVGIHQLNGGYLGTRRRVYLASFPARAKPKKAVDANPRFDPWAIRKSVPCPTAP